MYEFSMIFSQKNWIERSAYYRAIKRYPSLDGFFPLLKHGEKEFIPL